MLNCGAGLDAIFFSYLEIILGSFPTNSSACFFDTCYQSKVFKAKKS
jgi:hypothetical protein